MVVDMISFTTVVIGLLLILIILLLFLIFSKPPKKPEVPLDHTAFVEMDIYRHDMEKKWNPNKNRKYR